MDKYFKRKEKLVINDFKTAFNSYEKIVGKIINVRQWTVTLMSGLVLLSLTETIPVYKIILVAILIIISFLLLELRERSSMSFDKKEIVELEKIFMIKNDFIYKQKIYDYIFRDLKLEKLGRKSKFKHLLKSCRNIEVVFWYLTWFVLWVFIYNINIIANVPQNISNFFIFLFFK